MPTVDFAGIEEYSRFLEALGRGAEAACNLALYDGARILADAVQAEIDNIPDLDPRDRQGLHDGLGVARFWEEKGSVVTKVGWEGYNSWRTWRWPNGKPNALIARAQIRGTSWIRPNRFTARAARKAKAACVEAMRKRLDAEIAKTIK